MLTQTKHSSRWLLIALIAAFAIAALLVAYLTFIAVRDFVTSWQMTSLPGVTISDSAEPGAAAGQGEVPGSDINVPLQPPGGLPPPEWDGANRVSVLLMGLDYRDWQAGEGPPRTDSMILFTIDPLNRTAGRLSIPRDLWVNIPGSGYGRINTAYQIGEALQLPGGGPAMAAETVESLLGVPIDYYGQIDFRTFIRFIDEIGGVKIEIPEKIKVDPLGDNNGKTLKPGKQTLNGELALAYARARKTEGGDFDRAQRTQQVILAIRDRMLEKDNLPRIISRAPVLYNELSSGVRTNLTLDQIIRLAWTASQIPSENIKQGAIGSDQVAFASSPDGSQEVLKPLTEKIRALRDEIFTQNGPASPLTANLTPEELVKLEGARVSVLNGSSTAGLASRTSDYLKSLGVNVTQTENAQKLTPYTEVTFFTGKPYTVQFLFNLLGIGENRIFHVYDPASPVDIQIIVGDDWAQQNSMP